MTDAARRRARPDPGGAAGPEPIEVERARASDLAELVWVAGRALPDPWSESALAAELAREDARVWLARGSRRGVGFVALRRCGGEAELLLAAVDPAVQRRGIGRRLLDAALGAEPGLERIHLEVREGAAAARAFYADGGFVPVGCRVRYYADGEDAILMTRTSRAAVHPAVATR